MKYWARARARDRERARERDRLRLGLGLRRCFWTGGSEYNVTNLQLRPKIHCVRPLIARSTRMDAFSVWHTDRTKCSGYAIKSRTRERFSSVFFFTFFIPKLNYLGDT